MADDPAGANIEDCRLAADTAFRAKDFSGARSLYRALCASDPGNGYFSDRYAFCFIALGEWEQAEAAWRDAISRHGAVASRLDHVVRCLMELRQFEQAEIVLQSYRDDPKRNSISHVQEIFVEINLGDLDSALTAAGRLAALNDGRVASNYLDHLSWLLRTGVPQPRLRIALALIGQITPLFDDPVSLLKPGIDIAGRLLDWPEKLAQAEGLMALRPDLADGQVHRIDALADMGRLDEAEAALAQLRQNASAAQRVEDLTFRLASLRVWRRRLTPDGHDVSFNGRCVQISAAMMWKQYDRALDYAADASRAWGDHPWFTFLAGQCYQALGATDRALECLERTCSGSAVLPDYLVALCKLQSAAGLAEAAGRTLRRLQRVFGFMPVTALLAETIAPAADESPIPESKAGSDVGSLSWLHGGDSGDVIYALAAMRGGGGGRLYLGCNHQTREPMDAAKIAFLTPLLQAQTYVRHAAPWAGEPIARDFNVARHYMAADADLATIYWRYTLTDLPPDVQTPWLEVPDAPRHRRPVFARSHRYRNPNWSSFWTEIKRATPDAIFVGTAEEFTDFGHGEHCIVQDALGLATIIAGASLFIGNQSLPYALAEGLKVGRVLEVSPYVRNCIFPGALPLGF